MVIVRTQMINVNDSDAETVERLKKWWADNGKTTVAGLVIGLGSVFGWGGYQSYQAEMAEAASSLYQLITSSATADRMEDVRRHGERLMSEHPSSGYAALTALFLSKAALVDKQSDEARAHLQWVLENAKLEELKSVARLRLARLALDAGNVEEAWGLISSVEAGKFANLYASVRGDILLAQGKPNDARAAYEEALEATGAGGPEFQHIRMKLDDLGTLNVSDSATNG